MQQHESLPSIVIVGRPNVGKSTLFNALTGTRRSIVGDEPGITRDRIYGKVRHRGRNFELIDTGGIIPNDEDLIPSEIFRQARVALDSAAHIIFLIDGRTEITAPDRELARLLKRSGKPVVLAVNKIDSPKSDNLVHEFHELGFEHVFPISAEHQHGVGDLLDFVTQGFEKTEEDDEAQKPVEIRVAIIGRPNVGKSTLLNSLAGSDRAIVSPVAGTTRDAVDERVHREGVDYVFVDTAGIRRKGKTKLMAEKLSVVMSRRHIRMAHVVIIVLDATEGFAHADATIAGYAHEGGRAVIIVVNKWDAIKDQNQKKYTEAVRDEMKFLDYAPLLFTSAMKGIGVDKLYGLIREAFDSASKRIGTGELNRFAEKLDLGPEIKIKFMTQASIRPPTFVVFTNKKYELHFSHERNVINRLRKQFGFKGTPLVVKTKVTNKR